MGTTTFSVFFSIGAELLELLEVVCGLDVNFFFFDMRIGDSAIRSYFFMIEYYSGRFLFCHVKLQRNLYSQGFTNEDLKLKVLLTFETKFNFALTRFT